MDIKDSLEKKVTPPKRIKVWRHELKYFISFTEYALLAGLLQKTMQKDPFGKQNNEYWIRSIYFDSFENNDYYEKMIGVNTRKKIRIRIYDVNQKMVKIEIKNKFKEYMLKETATISREAARELIAGNKNVLLHHNNQTLHKIYYFMSRDIYRPAVIVDYEREAYICNLQNIRITFDKNIRGNTVDFDLFNRHLAMLPVFDQKTMVVEIKYNRFIPDWIRNILRNFNSERYAISKYCLSRVII